VITHLADWETHMPLWVGAACKGDPMAEIESGLNWMKFEEINQRIYQRHRNQSLYEVLVYSRDNHREFMDMVETTPEDELFERG